MYDLMILGGGPAGLTAAVYAIRKRLDVLLISPDLGGKTTGHVYLPDNIDRFQVITGDDVVSRFRNQVEYLESTHKFERAEKVEAAEGGYTVVTAAGNRYDARAIIVATGAVPVKLNVPGEDKYRMRGLAYSAVSYAPLFFGRTAAVVGEGELGVRSALELAQTAQSVFLVTSSQSIPDTALGRKLKTADNVTLLDGHSVKEIRGDGSYAHSIIVTKGTNQRELMIDMTFVELELKPNSQCVADLVKLNEKQQIVVDSRNRTSRAGLFAAGDVTDVYAEQALICIGEGAKAALTAYEYILSL